MAWIFIAFLVVSLIHMAEEYFIPGGFMNSMKRLNPRFAPYVTVRMAVIINGLQLVLCVLAILVGERASVLALSIAGLLYINGWVHVLAVFKLRGYVPGVISGALLYIPLAAFAYAALVTSGHLNLRQALMGAALSLLYQAVPMAYLAASRALSQRSAAHEA